ncbi:MAG TPA: diguanylate cyclase [Candidatus Acidoferrales bacterium]
MSAILSLAAVEPIDKARRGGSYQLLEMARTVRQMPGLLWTTDKDLRITSSEGVISGIDAAAADTPTGGRVGEFLSDVTTPHIPAHRRALKGEAITYEFEMNGTPFYAQLRPLRDNSGQVVGCVGVAIDITERESIIEHLQQLVITDPVTGLANYRKLVEVVKLEIMRSDRTRREFSLLVLDLDGLKQVNDTYGHLYGTRALCRLGTILKSQSRSIDLAARYGGDEFCLVLPETSLEAANMIGRRIKKSLALDREHPQLSVSVGASSFPESGRTLEDLIAAADRELYREKAANKPGHLATNMLELRVPAQPPR